ncbi:MAG: hypothetical protein AAAC47_14510 [Pararhizobium sp.]
MDLALELGMPLAAIGKMPEREFARWAKYASQKGFPSRRIEYYLAQIAQLIAVTMGGSKDNLSAFLIPTRDESQDEPELVPPPTAEDIAAMRAAIGFRPRGKPRRKKVANG